MARFLASVWPALGHLYPLIAVAQALGEQGHAVAIQTIAAHYPLLDSLGIAHRPLRGLPGVSQDGVPPRGEDGDARARQATFQARFIVPMERWYAAVLEEIEGYRPDVLLNDPVSFAPLLAAERLGLPIATINATQFTWPGRRFGPFGPGLPPSDDPARQAFYAHLRARGEELFAEVVGAINGMRVALGLPKRPGSLAEATLSPYLQLVPSVPLLDYQRDDLPPQVHYIGDCGFDPPAALTAETTAWLDALPHEQPLALVSTSSIFTESAALVEAALAALPEAGIAVLATLTVESTLHSVAPRHPLAHLLRFAPHSAILPRATISVNHGAMGVVYKALRHARPMVMVPYGADQAETAQRVVAAGAGLRLKAAALNPEVLYEAVRQVLADDRYTAAAQAAAAALVSCSGERRAAQLLGELARTGRPVYRHEVAGDAINTMPSVQ